MSWRCCPADNWHDPECDCDGGPDFWDAVDHWRDVEKERMADET